MAAPRPAGAAPWAGRAPGGAAGAAAAARPPVAPDDLGVHLSGGEGVPRGDATGQGTGIPIWRDLGNTALARKGSATALRQGGAAVSTGPTPRGFGSSSGRGLAIPRRPSSAASLRRDSHGPAAPPAAAARAPSVAAQQPQRHGATSRAAAGGGPSSFGTSRTASP
ncbi:unnamed protein product, partial [Prorocentrum cordatum]